MQFARQIDAPKLLTLTAPHVDAPLADQLSQLRDAFSSLRSSKSWRAHVRGGFYGWQVTRNRETGQWHPHVHVMIDATFWPHEEIRDAWRAALNRATSIWSLDAEDALIVDIRAVHDRREAARYTARYVVHGDSLADWPPESVAEYALAISGRRVFQTFGSLVGTAEEPDDIEPEPADIELEVPVSMLVRLSRSGFEMAERAICAAWILWEGSTGLPPPSSDPPDELAAMQPGDLADELAKLIRSVWLWCEEAPWLN